MTPSETRPEKRGGGGRDEAKDDDKKMINSVGTDIKRKASTADRVLKTEEENQLLC